MSLSCRSLGTWALAVWFAVLVSVGEGWHLVPGNGHWIELPKGRGLIVGVVVLTEVERAPDARPSVTARGRDDLPMKDAGSCIICRFSGQAKQQRVAFDSPSLELFSQPVSEPACPVSGIRISSPFRIRAPPHI
ncbi:MAG: hypothetical protein FJ276_06665 [Planctomycetes bacterium]|nr:hypothetical protein [Planctomycetota bacterium]